MINRTFFVRLIVGLGALAGAAVPAWSDAGLQTESERRWFRNVRQLTFDKMGFEKAGEAYFSADGKRICFQAVPDGETEYQIYVLNLDGSGLKRVSTGAGATTCAYFHPDGEKMLFASNHLDQRPAVPPPGLKENAAASGRDYAWPFPPGMDIFEYDFKTEKLTKLVEAEGYDAEGSYSADGKRLVFTSMRDNDQEIYVSDVDGKNPRRITNKPGYDGGPFFSPDGERVVYRSDRANDGNLQIFTNNLEGTDERQLTSEADILHWCPFWHPSGKWLIYTRADHRGRPNYDLYLLSVDGKQSHRVTDDQTFDGLPVFSPDGRWLMWTSKRGDLPGAQVFIAEFIGLSPAGEVRAAE